MARENSTPHEADQLSPAEPSDQPRPDSPAVQAFAGCLHQLARTVKTCRLYDSGNPTVALFRGDLATALAVALGEHGPLQIRFTPQEIVFGQTPLYSARSREDNLALPFFRDGIRSLSLQPGITPREVDAIVDAYLAVTRRGLEDSDLVTLLWEAELEHVSVEYVSTEGDVEAGSDGDGAVAQVAAGSIAPWPRTLPLGASTPAGAGTVEAESADDTGRSDDRTTAGQAREVEASLLGLEIAAEAEVERFLSEFKAEQATPLTHSTFELIRNCMGQAVRESDRTEFRQFLPRLLHESVASGDWNSARECLYLQRDDGVPRDGAETFAQEIARAESLIGRNALACLERQSTEQQQAFFDFARELGPGAADLLMRGVAESQRQNLRRALAQTLAALVAGNPERLAPWLADERWYVVRNVVHIFGLMDGAAPIGLLRVAAKHAEFRVRREVVTVLARLPLAEARPLLREMLDTADTRLFGIILHQLSAQRDPDLAAMLLGRIEQDSFAACGDAEKRAVYQALAAVGGDTVVPVLEAHVMQGNWFQRGNDSSRIAAVMCLARIGTPGARAVLDRGAQSRRAEVAQACRAGLATLRPAA